MQEWYTDATTRPSTSSRVTINSMTAERVKFYWHVPSPGQFIQMGMTPLPVEDSVTKGKDIYWEVRRLCLKRLGGPLGMQAEHINQWLQEATWENEPDAS